LALRGQSTHNRLQSFTILYDAMKTIHQDGIGIVGRSDYCNPDVFTGSVKDFRTLRRLPTRRDSCLKLLLGRPRFDSGPSLLSKPL
jgi:hypothetical protein